MTTDEQQTARREQDSDGREAGGALNDDETAGAGADAVPDKTTGSGGSEAD
jgi:hypothetical protein